MDWAVLKWTRSDHFALKKKKTESIKPKEPICLPQKKTKKNKNEKGNPSVPKEKPHPRFAPSLSDQQRPPPPSPTTTVEVAGRKVGYRRRINQHGSRNPPLATVL